MPKDPFIREKFTKDRNAARKLVAEYYRRFPKDRYQTEVESWRHLQSQNKPAMELAPVSRITSRSTEAL
jgi:hypothetical protein